METVSIDMQPENKFQAMETLTTRQLFDLDALEDLRSHQRLQYNEAVNINLNNGYSDSLASGFAEKVIDSATTEYVKKSTFESDTAEKSVYDAIRSLSFDRVPDSEWFAGPIDSQTGEQEPSGRDRARHLFEEVTHEQYYATGNNPTTGAKGKPAVTELFVFSNDQRAARDAYRISDQDLARTEARRFRVGMLAGKERRNQLEREIEPTAVAYINQSQLFDEVQEQKYRTMFPDISDEDLANKMANYHTAKQRLHDLRTEHEAENGYHKFGILSRAHNKISSWFGGLSRTEKIGVAGAGVVAAGLLGLALTPLGAAGVGLMAGAKGYRSYMQSRSKLYERPDEIEKIQSTNGQDSKTLEELQTEARDKMTAARAERTERTDKINRKARFATAIGGLAIGGGLALQVAEHWGDIQNFFGDGSPRIEVPPADEHGPGPDGTEQPKAPVPVEAPREALPNVGGEDIPTSDGSWAPGGIDHYLDGHLGTTELTPAGLENFDRWVNGYAVQPGDTVWSLSEQYLQAQGVAHPDVYQIDAVKDAVLADFQARGLVGVNGWLSVGQSLLIK